MSPIHFYEHRHGNEPFLSKSAIIQLMDDYGKEKERLQSLASFNNPNNYETDRSQNSAKTFSALSGT